MSISDEDAVPVAVAETLTGALAPRVVQAGRPAARAGLLRRTLRLRVARVGLVLVLLVLAVAFLGPIVASGDPSQIVGPAFSPPGAVAPLGTDNLGRDLLIRFLHGGSVILVLAFLATVVGVGIGTLLGLIAGYRRGIRGQVIMRSLDVVLSFPPLLLALLFISLLGTKPWLILMTVAVSHVPYVARVIESASLAVTGRGFVQYAEMIGVPRRRILAREILPSVIAPLTVQFGLRLTYSIGTIASLAYLGFGRQGSAPDWGKMISENQVNLTQTPLPVLLPVAAIAILTVGVNLLTDGVGRAAGIDSGREDTT
jgi:peptide/nickel transport system permease protein